ncbi:cytochrome P450 [Trichodelitschia bisporula]|uniref:Cytochrome P450 n=1 Tax=Trichodelitschia bisporula TaxID=703511 RepID=A0A6G1I7C2_9PEZI|nr:cytochrome P450 [Trichodelitschia bisporula]
MAHATLVLLTLSSGISTGLKAFGHFEETPFFKLFSPVLAATTFVWFLYNYQIYPHFVSPLRHLPTAPGGLPVIGHVYARFQTPPCRDYLRFVKTVPNDGLIRLWNFWNTESLIITNAKSICEVLVTKSYDFEKAPKARSTLHRILGEGLIVTEGDLHKYQRKILNPYFGFRQVKDLYPVFWGKALSFSEVILSKLQEQSPANEKLPSGVVDVSPLASFMALDTIGMALTGHDFNTLHHNDDPLGRVYQYMSTPNTMIKAVLSLNILFPRWVASVVLPVEDRRISDRCAESRRLCFEMLREKRANMKASGEESPDILSKMINSNMYTDDEMTDHLLTFVAAGHETTAAAFVWAVYHLAKHPGIQKRLRDEIRANVSLDPAHQNEAMSSMEHLPLLNAVLNESLRLYPPVHQNFRMAVRDTSILGYPVLKGTYVVINNYVINRSPDLWGPTAEEFIPERWIDPETGKANKTGGASSVYANATFSHGARSCIGQGFARAEFRSMLAAFVHTFEMEMADPDEVPFMLGNITIKPLNGMKLRLRVAA